MVKKIAFIFIIAIAFGSSMFFDASAAPITNRVDLGGNDYVDWTDLGSPVPFPPPWISSPFNIASSQCALDITVENLSQLVLPSNRFRRVNEGSILGTGWRGNFSIGDALLFTTAPSIGPISITFDLPVMGAGAQIQPSGLGTFRAVIRAFDINDAEIESFTSTGTSNIAQNNSAIFIGLLDGSATIKRIEFSAELRVFTLQGWRYISWPFAINQLELVIPEPSVNAGADQNILAGEDVQLAGQAENYASIHWSGGNGTFSPGTTTLDAIYQPTQAEIAAGVVILTLTAEPIGQCVQGASDAMTINIQKLPTPIPTLSEWGMIVMSLILVGSAIWMMRRRRQAS